MFSSIFSPRFFRKSKIIDFLQNKYLIPFFFQKEKPMGKALRGISMNSNLFDSGKNLFPLFKVF
jgi:hypothetical protein